MTASLEDYGLRFHHLGLAVKTPEPALRFLTTLGYVPGSTVLDPLQNVNLLMCQHPRMPEIEVIYPNDGEGPIDSYLQQHSNGLVYHICYECDDLARFIAEVEIKKPFRLICVSKPKPAILFGGKKVSFYMVLGFGLIEIIDNSVEQ